MMNSLSCWDVAVTTELSSLENWSFVLSELVIVGGACHTCS